MTDHLHRTFSESSNTAMSAPLDATPAPDAALAQAVNDALATVMDPELRRPITELGMVESVGISGDGKVSLAVLLTIAGCPLRDTITADSEKALAAVPGVTAVEVNLKVMNQEQRDALKEKLRGAAGQRGIPFNQPDSLTKVYAVASGKGGVGKSSVTVNLACALAARGLRVGIVDADVYGFSVPALMGITQAPTRVDDMILPPVAYGVKVISIGMFVSGNQPVAWRGPMLHRALEQFLTDVYFGDLDALFLDLPPGTGDIAISVAQLLPKAEILVVTTPQAAAADVAERAGAIATQTGQKVAGVIENMSYLEMPDGGRMELFGSGGGAVLTERLTATVGAEVPLLGQIPLDIQLREGGDHGVPIVIGQPETPAGVALSGIASRLAAVPRGLAGMKLGLQPR
jgi:ATP-binding protein involved in chromosome partitioning